MAGIVERRVDKRDRLNGHRLKAGRSKVSAFRLFVSHATVFRLRPGMRSCRGKSQGRMAFVSYLGEEKFWILAHFKEKDEWEAGREGRKDVVPEALQFPVDQSTQDTSHSISTMLWNLISWVSTEPKALLNS